MDHLKIRTQRTECIGYQGRILVIAQNFEFTDTAKYYIKKICFNPVVLFYDAIEDTKPSQTRVLGKFYFNLPDLYSRIKDDTIQPFLEFIQASDNKFPCVTNVSIIFYSNDKLVRIVGGEMSY